MNWSVIFPTLIATMLLFYISEVKFVDYFSKKGVKPQLMFLLLGILLNTITYGIYLLIIFIIF